MEEMSENLGLRDLNAHFRYVVNTHLSGHMKYFVIAQQQATVDWSAATSRKK